MKFECIMEFLYKSWKITVRSRQGYLVIFYGFLRQCSILGSFLNFCNFVTVFGVFLTLGHHFRYDHEVDTLGEEYSYPVSHFLPRLMGHSEVEDAETVYEDRGHDHIHHEVGGTSHKLQCVHQTAKLIVFCLQGRV